jgi:DNA-directed RNA polymerase subunit K/omega
MTKKDKQNIARFDNVYETPQEEIVKNYPSIYELVIDTAIRARFLFKDLYRVDDIEEPFLMKKNRTD